MWSWLFLQAVSVTSSAIHLSLAVGLAFELVQRPKRKAGGFILVRSVSGPLVLLACSLMQFLRVNPGRGSCVDVSTALIPFRFVSLGQQTVSSQGPKPCKASLVASPSNYSAQWISAVWVGDCLCLGLPRWKTGLKVSFLTAAWL